MDRVRRQRDRGRRHAAVERVEIPPDRNRQDNPYPEPLAHAVTMHGAPCVRLTRGQQDRGEFDLRLRPNLSR